VALAELGVAHMLLYRFAIGCLAFAPIALTPSARLKRRDWWTLVAASIFGVPVQFLVQFEGLARTTVAHASLMVGTLPVLLALASSWFTQERLDARGWIAVGASTAGTVAIVSSSSGAPGTRGPTFAGDLLVAVSLLAAVVWILLSKRLMERYPPVVVSTHVILLGTLFLATWVVIRAGVPPFRLSRSAWLALAGQGLLATTAATLLWNWGVARVPAARAGVFVNLEPVVGALLGVTLLGETLDSVALLGAGLIIGAALVVTTSRP